MVYYPHEAQSMNPPELIKKGNPSIKRYYDAIAGYSSADIHHETALRSAFQNLLAETAKKRGWMLVPELSSKVSGVRVVPDGTLNDQFNLPRGYWEAKDEYDDLDVEIAKKIEKGYPTLNMIFEDTRVAVLYQDGNEVFRCNLTNPSELLELLNRFLTHTEPAIESFEKAVVEFKEKVPQIAKGLAEKINEAHEKNKGFKIAFESFYELCKASLNPNISRAAVDEMLIQHLLTERLFRTIFNDPDFIHKNAIAVEIEKVITALTQKSFNRQEFLKSLDRFYFAIEEAAYNITDFTDKQHFLNRVYQDFFQGYSVKIADTHGIVYTPQPIVDFMCASVEEVLKEEFGLSLGSSEVNILDPCTGTGNFIVNIMRRINKRDLPKMYKEHLFANEVMLLPYYISALNIEHAYFEITQSYEPFEGLCFVDTLDMAERHQIMLSFTKENTERVEREKKTPITVIIGNPPYNVGQINENDNNKNRKYDIVDLRIRDTYTKDSKATNKNALSDAYVKFFRWATDRLQGRDGIVTFVSNNGFLRGIAFDGFRKHLEKDYHSIYHFDFKGNARTSGERRRKEGGNIFKDLIRVGVGIKILVRNNRKSEKSICYHEVQDYWHEEQKTQYLLTFGSKSKVPWQDLKSDTRFSWLVPKNDNEFMSFPALGSRDAKKDKIQDAKTVFRLYSRGVATCRDDVAYDFNLIKLSKRINTFINDYNAEIDRYKRSQKANSIDDFVMYEKVKWSESLKRKLISGHYATYSDSGLRYSIYRPFVKMYLYFDQYLIERRYQFHHIFPNEETEKINQAICVSGLGGNKKFDCLVSCVIPEVQLVSNDQCFPFYTFDEDGSNQQENITDWSLEKYQEQYKDKKIKKWDIFYYIYGLLHHPGYREKYADNLKRDLPRIPFAPDFWAFSKAGKELAKWHLDYETVEPYKLEFQETKGVPLSYLVVDKMRLSKDKTELKVNPSLTLVGIPLETFEYSLGNRSALEWVIEYYVVKTFPRSGIKSDPNNYDDEEYIVKLVGQVIRVSLETVRIVKSLPKDFGG